MHRLRHPGPGKGPQSGGIFAWLRGGDLRSDGDATLVAEAVLRGPGLLPDLVKASRSSDRVVRGRARHAPEWVARSRPVLLRPHFARSARLAHADPEPFARWHMAMLLGDLCHFPETVGRSLRV